MLCLKVDRQDARGRHDERNTRPKGSNALLIFCGLTDVLGVLGVLAVKVL